MKKTLLKTIYKLGGFAPFHRANREKILILTYHRFSPGKNPSKISGAEFTAHLEYLKKYCRVLSLSETIERLKNGKTLPPNATVITIDDGYADAYEIAFPILKKFDFPATLFAITDFLDGKCWLWTDLMRYILLTTDDDFLKVEFENGAVIETNLSDEAQKFEAASRVNSRLKTLPNEKKEIKIKEIAESLKVEIPALPPPDYAPLGWRQAREMDAENLQIESHTVTHPILTNINQRHLETELRTSKERLEAILEKKIKHFCYPNGTFNDAVRKAVENAGYESAVTTDYGFNERQASRFLLKRIDALSAIESFAQSVSGFESLKGKITK